MIEWLEGYWTAMRHVAAAQPPAAQGPTLVEWLAALGSAGAALSAAVAAWLTWLVARKNWQSTIEMERATVMSACNALFEEANEKAIEVIILYSNLKPKLADGMRYIDKLKDILAGYNAAPEEYLEIAKQAVVGSYLKDAKSVEDLQAIRVHLTVLRGKMFRIDVRQKGRQRRAAMFMEAAAAGSSSSRSPTT